MEFQGKGLKLKLVVNNCLITHALLILAALAITFMTFALLPQPFGASLNIIAKTPLVFALCFLAVLLVVYFVYFVSSQVWLSFLTSGLFFFTLLTINRYKVYLRGDPLMPTDLFLGGEAFSIAVSSELKISPFIIAIPVLIIIASVALFVFFRFKKPKLYANIIGAVCCIAAAFLSLNSVYTDRQIYDSVPIYGNIYSSVNEYTSKGYIPAFLYHINDFSAKLPPDYSAEKAQKILDAYVQPEGFDEIKPDIFIIMSEAFWDITQVDALDFSEKGDPIPAYHEIAENSISGDLYVNTYGGGTDNTEFSVLTGFATWAFNNSVPSAYKFYLRHETPSMASFLNTKGYNSVALHPGFDWFYNRRNVYRWFGFEEFISQDDFDVERTRKGNYISDDADVDMLVKTYERYLDENGKPFFCFNVNIQNHGPYDAGLMYGYGGDFYDLKPGVSISDTSETVLTNYIQGIKDSDASLKKLTDYLENSDRPAVVMFFGDHLPMLGNDYLTYKELGYDIGYEGGLQSVSDMHKTSFVIWANDKYREQKPEFESLTKQKLQFSANSLGMYMLETLGFKPDALYSYMYEHAGELPVMTSWFMSESRKKGEGLTLGYSRKGSELLNRFRMVQYYELFDTVR